MRRLLYIALLLSLDAAFVGSARAQNDPMAKWKPSVGDRFVYDYVYDYSEQYKLGKHVHDTLVVTILQTNFDYDSARNSVVVVSGNNDYWFHSSDSISSAEPIVVETNDWGAFYYIDSPSWIKLDYSKSRDSETIFGGQSITIAPAIGSNDNGQYTFEYSPQLRWFFKIRYVYFYQCGNYDIIEDWTSQLISAEQTSSHVSNSRGAESAGITNLHSESRETLAFNLRFNVPTETNLCLLDPLGRSIRKWQMPIEDGGREITLNVADVPSGMYFLRVSGEGIDEVKKVCISH